MSVKQLSFDGVGTDDAATRIGHTVWAAIMDARRGNPAYRLTEDSLVAALRPAVAAELPKAPRPAARVNGRNTLFDALAAACGLEAPFTKSAAGQVAKAMNEIAKAFPSVDAAEMTRVALAVRKKYENAGPIAVSAHFHEFVRKVRPKAQPTAPAGWLAKLNELFSDSTLAKGGRFEITKETEYQWLQLDPQIRAMILAAM